MGIMEKKIETIMWGSGARAWEYYPRNGESNDKEHGR